MPRIVLFCLVCIIVSIPLPQPAAALSREINISGNSKTDTEYIRETVENCLMKQEETNPESLDTNQLKQCLLNTKLFADVEVSLEENILSITIDERLSLIPFPLVQSGSDGETSVGIFVLESNFLGLGKTVALGGITSAESGMLFLMVEDPSVSFTDWKYRISTGRNKTQLYLYDGEDEIDGMMTDGIFFKGALGYRFEPELSASLLFGRTFYRFQQFEDYEQPADFSANSMGIELTWDFSIFRFYFEEGFSGKFRLERQIERSDQADFVTETEIQAGWQIGTLNDQALQIGFLGGFVQNADRRTALKIGSENGTRGIPNNGAWAESFAAISLDYQIPLLSGSYGTWTLAPFFDAGIIKLIDSDDEVEPYAAYGLGSYFFLKQVAIPGIGIMIGTNDSYQERFFKLSIGFNF